MNNQYHLVLPPTPPSSLQSPPTVSSENNDNGLRVDPTLYRKGVIEHAYILGMDPFVDESLLWIAEKSLLAPLPRDWSQMQTHDCQIYFYNSATGSSSWFHPCDEMYRKKYRKKKNEMEEGLRRKSWAEAVTSQQRQRRTSCEEGMRRCSAPERGSKDSGKLWDSPGSTVNLQTGDNSPLPSPPPSDNWKATLDSFEKSLLTLQFKSDIEEKVKEFELFYDYLKVKLGIVSSSSELQKRFDEVSSSLKTELEKTTSLGAEVDLLKRKEDKLTKRLVEHEVLGLGVKKEYDALRQISEKKELEWEDKLAQLESLEKVQELQRDISSRDTTIKQMRESHFKDKEDSEQRLQTLTKQLREEEETRQKQKSSLEELQTHLKDSQESFRDEEQRAQSLSLKVSSQTLQTKELQDEVAHCKDLLHEARTSESTKIASIQASFQSQIVELQSQLHLKETSEVELTEKHQKSHSVNTHLRKCLGEQQFAVQRYKEKYTIELHRSKSLNEQILSLQGNIRVFCRLRPSTSSSENENLIHHLLDEQKISFNGTEYEYDRVFKESTPQKSVFTEVSSAVGSSMEGYHVCIFAYGQTGSGKTYTMEGEKDNRGVNYRALELLFQRERKLEKTHKFIFRIMVLEVYNESLNDLLVEDTHNTNNHESHDDTKPTFNSSSSKRRESLTLHMRKDEVTVEGATEHRVTSCQDVTDLLSLASTNRQTASNNVNERSSRSHLVLSVKITGKKLSNNTHIKGKLNLIDLAGSERLKSTTAEGQRLKEAQNINKSLSALGDVIHAMGDDKCRHVPYRNSKLTFLLQDSLKPKAKVLVFVNINPSEKSAPESTCSLKFAARCRRVKLGKARKDVVVGNGSSLLHGSGGGGKKGAVEHHGVNKGPVGSPIAGSVGSAASQRLSFTSSA